MKLFISWSGIRSKKIAERFVGFLKGFLQGTDPFFSEGDIDKGTRWFDIISTELEQTNFGIIFLTKENRSSPWIHFEAGALAKNLEMANLCPILFGLEHSDIEGPLPQFQLTAFNKPEIYKVCVTINSKLEKKLDDKTFNWLFDTLWDKAEADIKQIIEEDLPEFQLSGKSNKEMLEDIWHQLRRITYTEAQAVNDKFIEQLIDALDSHVSSMSESGLGSRLSSLQQVLSPVEHLISEIKEKSMQTSMINKYEKIRAQIMKQPAVT